MRYSSVLRSSFIAMTALFVCASAGCIFDEPSLSTDEIPPGNNATSMGNNANSGTSSSNQDTGAPNNTSSPNGATSAPNNTGGNGETGAPNNTEPTPNNNVDPPPNNANPSDCTDFNALATTRCPEWGDFVAYGSFTTDPEGIPAPDLCESLGQDETLYSCAQENTSCLEMILCIEDRASGELFLDSPSLDCQFLQEELIFACTGEWELYPESGNFLDRCSERDEVDGDVFDCLETAGTCQEVAACIDTNMDLELPFDDNPGGCAAGFACEAASGQVECPASDFGTPCRACGLTCDAVDEICANGALIEPRCGQDDPDCNIFACGTVACQQAPQGDCSMVSGGLVCHARGDAAGSPYCARPMPAGRRLPRGHALHLPRAALRPTLYGQQRVRRGANLLGAATPVRPGMHGGGAGHLRRAADLQHRDALLRALL